MDRPVIVGHRGAAGLAPENTLASFAAAVEAGADAVELDVQFTADGYPVALHDETLERMAGVRAHVRDYTESVLQGFDVGFRHGHENRGERIPALEDIARLVPAAMDLHVELKDYNPIGEDHLRLMVGILDRNGGIGRCVVSSPHEDVLAEVLRLAPGCRIALLLFRGVKVPTDAARRAAYIGCSAVHPNVSLVDEGLVDVCHRHDMNVFAFTVNERGMMRKLMQMGVNGFFTDYPDRLREECS